MIRLSRVAYVFLIGLILIGLGACATTQINTSPSPRPDRQVVWSVLPLINNTATPYAGVRAQHQLAALLSAHGVKQTLIAPGPDSTGPLPLLTNNANTQQQELTWAHSHGAQYALLGSVDEWRYKIGLDGQPAVGFTLHLVDLKTGDTVWSGVASASGTSREGLAVLSQRVLTRLTEQLLP